MNEYDCLFTSLAKVDPRWSSGLSRQSTWIVDEVEGSKQLVATTFFELVTYRYVALAGASVPSRAGAERKVLRRRGQKRSTPEGGSGEKWNVEYVA